MDYGQYHCKYDETRFLVKDYLTSAGYNDSNIELLTELQYLHDHDLNLSGIDGELFVDCVHKIARKFNLIVPKEVCHG